MAAIPFFKLGALLIRTLAKPMAKRIQTEASTNPSISKWATALGQFSHRFTARLNVLASGYRLVEVKPLDPKEALSRGAEIIGETVIFTTAGVILLVEVSRQKASEARREKQLQEEHDRDRQEIEDRFNMLIERMDHLEELLSAKSSWWGLSRPKATSSQQSKPHSQEQHHSPIHPSHENTNVTSSHDETLHEQQNSISSTSKPVNATTTTTTAPSPPPATPTNAAPDDVPPIIQSQEQQPPKQGGNTWQWPWSS